MKYKEQLYLDYDYFDGDMITNITLHKKSLVKTRKHHKCSMSDHIHNIEVGTMAVRETAVIDGEFLSSYLCTDCIDAWFEEIFDDVFLKEHLLV